MVVFRFAMAVVRGCQISGFVSVCVLAFYRILGDGGILWNLCAFWICGAGDKRPPPTLEFASNGLGLDLGW